VIGGEFQEDPWNKGEIPWRMYLVIQVMFPSLWTNCNQTYTNCKAFTVSDRCGVSKRSMEQKERYSGEGTSFKKMPFVIDHSQPNLYQL